MNRKIFFASLITLFAGLPSTAADRFQLTPCDEVAPSPRIQLPAIDLPNAQAPARGNGSLLDQARKVNAMPLPLIPSASEQEAVDQASDDAEHQQITRLWVATLDRSPDIQFVIICMAN